MSKPADGALTMRPLAVSVAVSVCAPSASAVVVMIVNEPSAGTVPLPIAVVPPSA